MNGFRWDSNCVLPPDGVSVCADESQYVPASAMVSGSGYRPLPHKQIAPWSMRLWCDEPALTCTDDTLHGHQQWVGSQSTHPFVDHSLGLLKLPDASKAWAATYSYVRENSPGRWIRTEWGPGGSVTPSMCCGSVQWAATIAGRINRPVHFENDTFSHVLELPNNRYTGRLRMDARAIIERLRIDIGNYDPVNGWATRLDRVLLRGMPCVTCASGATRIDFPDLEIYADRLPDEYWREVLNTPAKWNAEKVRGAFQNSPYGAGIAFTPQSGRIVKGLRVNVGRLNVHDMPGSCVLGGGLDVYWDAQTLDIGSSYLGRPEYEVNGHVRVLLASGHSRTSMDRVVAGARIDHYRYRSLNLTNPASPDEHQTGCVGASDTRGDGWTMMPDIDIDLRGSKYEAGIGIGVSGVFRGRVIGGGTDFNPKASGALNTTIDLEIEGKPPILSSASENGQANWARLDCKLLMRGKAVVPDGNGGFIDRPDAPSTIRVKRNLTHPEGHTQNVWLRYTNNRTKLDGTPAETLGLIWLPDLAATAPADCVPTTIYIEGGTWNNIRTQLVSVNAAYDVQAWPANIADYPVRIIVTDAVLNAPKSAPQDNTYAQQFAILELRDCTTPGGKLIDVAKVIDGTFWD